MKRRQKERLAENAKLAHKEAMGDFSHLKNKKGEIVGQRLPQPTLPKIDLDDDDDTSTLATRTAPSTKDYYYADKGSLSDYPPPMPAYNPYSTHQPAGSYAQFNASTTSMPYDEPAYAQYQPYDDDDTARLTNSASPFAHANHGASIARHGTPLATSPSTYDSTDGSPQTSYPPSYTSQQRQQTSHDAYNNAYYPSPTPQPQQHGRYDDGGGYDSGAYPSRRM